MQQHDLFNDASVTVKDVEFWLRDVPRFDDTTSQNRILHYIKTYDVVNKIMREKSTNAIVFSNRTIQRDKFYLSHAIEHLARPIFKPMQITPYGELKRREKAAIKAAIHIANLPN